MKTKEELSALKEEVETVSKKLAELNDEELEQVTGGADVKLIYPVALNEGLKLAIREGGRTVGSGEVT